MSLKIWKTYNSAIEQVGGNRLWKLINPLTIFVMRLGGWGGSLHQQLAPFSKWEKRKRLMGLIWTTIHPASLSLFYAVTGAIRRKRERCQQRVELGEEAGLGREEKYVPLNFSAKNSIYLFLRLGRCWLWRHRQKWMSWDNEKEALHIAWN